MIPFFSNKGKSHRILNLVENDKLIDEKIAKKFYENFVEKWREVLDNGGETDAGLTYLSKAFD